VRRLESDNALLWLAGGTPASRRLNAVVTSIAQQVRERRFEPGQDVAVDLGALADDLEPDLLAELAGEVANRAR
jgi:hypothetical protein